MLQAHAGDEQPPAHSLVLLLLAESVWSAHSCLVMREFYLLVFLLILILDKLAVDDDAFDLHGHMLCLVTTGDQFCMHDGPIGWAVRLGLYVLTDDWGMLLLAVGLTILICVKHKPGSWLGLWRSAPNAIGVAQLVYMVSAIIGCCCLALATVLRALVGYSEMMGGIHRWWIGGAQAHGDVTDHVRPIAISGVPSMQLLISLNADLDFPQCRS